MAYAKGSKILAADYNGFVGTPASGTNALGAFASEAAATGKIGAIWGVGYGRWGYGQTSPALTTVASGSKVLASNWNNLVTINNNIATRTGTTITNYATISSGNKINHLTNLAADINTLNTNRSNNGGGTWVLLGSNTRTTTWNSSIDATATVAFSTGDLARYWFNSGSTIMIRIRHNSTATTQDTDWNTFLSTQVGDIYIWTESTGQSASSPGGTLNNNLGYWDLTATNQTVFTRTAGTGAYSGDLVCTIQVARNGAANVAGNGDNGSAINIYVLLTDNHTGFQDILQGATIVEIWGYRNTAIFTPASPATVTFSNTFN